MSAIAPINALSLPARSTSSYPPAFISQLGRREKRKLGDHFGLRHFGVNLTVLQPGAISALSHHHRKQDEFIYILVGQVTLLYGDNHYLLQAGDCCGFAAGTGLAHQLRNDSDSAVHYLEIGDRQAGDEVHYPGQDLVARSNEHGQWCFYHQDGRPW